MDYKARYPNKVIDAPGAVAKIKNGSRVFIGTGCGEPQHLIRTMLADVNLLDIMIFQMLSSTLADYMDDEDVLRRFSVKLFFISNAMRQAAFEGKIDYIPSYLSQIPRMFKRRQIGLDVALVQVSPPDRFGYCSLGVSVDITRAGLESARFVIAQVNEQMPRTWGDSFIHIDQIDHLVPFDEPLVEMVPLAKNVEVSRRIGHYVAQLVEDGATLQIGFGHMPNAILQYLEDKKDLGLHTQVITDAFLPLFEKGVVTNRQKHYIPRRAVSSLCMGSKVIYDYIDNNPLFYFRSSEFVNDPTIIANNDNLISISSALEVDLTGQVCTDSIGYKFYSGIGDQVDFIRGSAMSKGGFSIIAMPATASNGRRSRIVPHLGQGAGVATTRGDVNFVVTEYGIAELQGKSIYRRVMELAQIAHPKFREKLIEHAKKRHYIFADQLPPASEDLLFIEDYRSTMVTAKGKTISFRPLLPSDEFAYRNFFYSLKEKTIYYRYFYNIKLFTHEMLQEQWASIDYRSNISLIGLSQEKGHKEIMAIGSYAKESERVAEVAFMVREDYQNLGIASHLIEQLEVIARQNGYEQFSASVLSDNRAMLRVFTKRYANATFTEDGHEIRVVMPFEKNLTLETIQPASA
mgnify:CR=1 FL=1